MSNIKLHFKLPSRFGGDQPRGQASNFMASSCYWSASAFMWLPVPRPRPRASPPYPRAPDDHLIQCPLCRPLCPPAVSSAAAGVLFAASACFDCTSVVGAGLASALAALSSGAGALANVTVLQLLQSHVSSSVDKFASEDQRTHLWRCLTLCLCASPKQSSNL